MNKIPTNLKSVVPKATRRRIYKQALVYYTQYNFEKPNNKYHQANDNIYPLGLCLLLPCMLWNLIDYMTLAPDQNPWAHSDTVIAFPEINSYLYDLNGIVFDEITKTKVRITALTEILANFK